MGSQAAAKMNVSTKIVVSRDPRASEFRLSVEGTPLHDHVVHRSRHLESLRTATGIARVPIRAAVFWEWVEYSPLDNFGKGAPELCAVLEV